MVETEVGPVALPLTSRPRSRVTMLVARAAALLRGRCPRCLEGRVFSGRLAMHETCPACGLSFGREWGYFFGAMYFSYGLSCAGIGAFLLLFSCLFPELSWWPTLGLATAAFLPFVPWAFRASRVAWLYFDHLFDPR